jgi:GH15 family glucan-1,4-alpha-glucosidase
MLLPLPGGYGGCSACRGLDEGDILMDNLAQQGQVDGTIDLLTLFYARPGSLELYPEQIDPSRGALLDNARQVFSHDGLMAAISP